MTEQIIITDRLGPHILRRKERIRFVAFRHLSGREISFARKHRIERFFLPALDKPAANRFYREFDRLWSAISRRFPSDHPFWRNVVSSKMQEWERSAAYFVLAVFTIDRLLPELRTAVALVCGSIEEEAFCRSWASAKEWPFEAVFYRGRSCKGRRILQYARNLKNALRSAANAAVKKYRSSGGMQAPIPQGTRSLLVSLFYSSRVRAGNFEDNFFGRLHRRIEETGEKTAYLAGPMGKYSPSARNLLRLTDAVVFTPFALVSWMQVFRAVWRSFHCEFFISGIDFEGVDFAPVLNWNARRSDFFFNVDAEVFYLACRRLLAANPVRKLIVPYEGNVFERACIQAFRQISVAGTAIGYSHAVIFDLNLKMRVAAGESETRPEPDRIVSSGPKTRALLEGLRKDGRTTIFEGCSLRWIPEVEKVPITDRRELRLLAALDGVWSSVSVIEWLIRARSDLQDYHVVLRGHPNVPVEQLLKQCVHPLPDRFEISRGGLTEELKQCFCVLYRQTSIGLQAILNGIPAVHISIDAPLSCDPLAGLAAGKWTANSAEALVESLKEIRSLDVRGRKRMVREASEFCRSYFAAPDSEKISLFLDA